MTATIKLTESEIAVAIKEYLAKRGHKTKAPPTLRVEHTYSDRMESETGHEVSASAVIELEHKLQDWEDSMKLYRWYARWNRERTQASYRMPVELTTYEESGRPRVMFRTSGGGWSGCSGRAWMEWQQRAELMPEDFKPKTFPE